MLIKKIDETVSFLRNKGITEAKTGIVLGTGLGKMVKEIDIELSINYSDIPHFPVSTVESHSGKLIYGKIGTRQVLAMQGRFHYYEGYNLAEITFPIRVMKFLGVEEVLLSNAAGALNPAYQKGSLMLLDDHINFLPDNPLRGKNYNELGPRFPDMSRPYSKKLNDMFKAKANKRNTTLHEGVYVAFMGPNLETRAEYRMFRNFSDAVGMSTVPEVIVCNQMSLPCAAVSVLTDECDPDNLQPANLDEILEVAGKAEVKMTELFVDIIKEL